MVYVALLRGINVGGKNKIDMKQLKQAFEEAGMQDVVTYINSGNIIFTSNDQSKDQIAQTLETAIHHHFGLHIKVLVLNRNDMDQIMQMLPDTWRNDDQMKGDVLFLWEHDESVMANLPNKEGIDTVIYAPGAILWSVDKKNVTKSGISKLIGTKLYQQMTVRNVNTARKVYELMLRQSK